MKRANGKPERWGSAALRRNRPGSLAPGAMTRVLASVVLVSLFSGFCCTRNVPLQRERMKEGTALERSRVFLKGGREYRFEKVAFTPDSLVGYYRVLQEAGSDREGIRFDEVIRSLPLALIDVDSVLVVERSLRKGFLYGAGIGALAGVIFAVFSGDDDGGRDDAGGKPDLPRPLR